MIKETVVINVDTKEAVDNVDDLNKSIKKTGETSQETKNTLDTITGGAASKFTKLIGTVGGVIKSFKTLRVAIIASGVGALALAVLAVGKAFTSSEEGQNKFAKLMGVIGVVTGNFMDVVADLGESIIKLFTEPKQVLIDFGQSIKKWITGQIELTLETVSLLGSAFKKIFKGDFSGALEDAGKATKKFLIDANPMLQFYKSVGKASAEFVKQTAEEVKSAQKVADSRAKADKIERKLVVRRAELENKIAQLRLKSREEDKFGAAERKQALLDAQVLEDELLVKEKEVLKLRSEAIQLENTFSRSTKENLNAEAEAKAALLRQEAARTNQQRQTQRELNRLNKEIQADENRAAKEKEDAEKAKKKRKEDEQKAVDDAEALRIQKLKKESEERIKIEEEEARKKEQIKETAFNQAVAIAGAESKLGKALLIAKQIQNAKELAIEIGKTVAFSTQAAARSTVAVAEGTAQTAKIGFPQNIPMLIGYAAQAVGIIGAIKSATSKAKAPISLPSSSNIASGVRSAAPQAPQSPSFNLVGQGGTNQLAEAIGSQSQQPVRAYVVSNDVTTAQSLDRNIVESASL